MGRRLLLALPLVVTSCTSPDREPSPPAVAVASPTPALTSTRSSVGTSTARVEVDVYSGRQNPEWVLGTEQAEELADMIDRLPPSSETTTPQLDLGFRGFLVHGLISPLAVRFDRLRVTQGAVFGERGTLSARFDDPRSEIFTWLAQRSATQLSEALQGLVASPTPPGAGQ